ncbi:zinc ribbon domain-containing protein [Promethearchaeum syntrophicum]|uniref:Zinc ribbon domain-containing protein n=1 Tax=Promethearchaeum syntrophicum TaxID=2594042 RepID=A0A5B9DDA9_9ARCH|nr:zinc ribbon domain-containing protein [Candidatus Prometheoarchaeum syntrophicum]QEE16760.1 hypothetical protein DSAG12_02590 [Candidatus Prometheoarchaeum syntrophicum]
MENNEYQTISYGKYENSSQETDKKTETTASSIEEQFFDLPFRERMKIHKNRMKLKIKTKSQDLKAKAKIKSEQLRVKSQEISNKIREKIEEHKAQEKHRQQNTVSPIQKKLETPHLKPLKFCSECGVEVTPSGKFCPGCGAIH